MESNNKTFDLIVIGAGPGGYPAAIKAAQNGKSVALVEAKEPGGTCLNRGCIPTKTLIAGAEILERIKDAKSFGIEVGPVSVEYSKMVARKDKVVNTIVKGLDGLISSNNISLIKGHGKFISPREVKVTGQDNCILTSDHIIIATGSEPRKIPAFPFDYERIHDSTSLLEVKKLPKSLVVIGGGIIGSEFASLFASLGVEVTILELLPRIIPMEDKALSAALTHAFQKKGIKIHTGIQVAKIEHENTGIKVFLADGKEIRADIALVSVGRSLNTSSIGLEKAGVLVQENGIIPVNEKMETNVPGIYAVGDIASKWWLAHVATHQGIVAANNVCGIEAHMNYSAIPSVIFTHPEIATVGLTLEDALAKSYQAIIGAFPFQALGKSQAAFQTEGFAQVVVDKKTGQLLGAQVMGHEASTLIAEMAIAITNELTLESITETIHAHPTIAEAWMEAAFMATGDPLHLPPLKKKKT